MRPRVFPAEDFVVAGSTFAGAVSASMRPRVFPAEDVSRRAPTRATDRAASMRPRVFPAEDPLHGESFRPPPKASMRPRVFPAEDADGLSGDRARATGFNEAAGIPRGRRGNEALQEHNIHRFNEAAGIPRGRHRLVVRAPAHQGASMRPRVFPAEDAQPFVSKLPSVEQLQ